MNATQTRMTEMMRDLAFGRLSEYPDRQAFAIAEHYVSMAHLALELHRVLEARRLLASPHSNPCVNHAIGEMVCEIKRHHLIDLGLELEWPSPPETHQTNR